MANEAKYLGRTGTVRHGYEIDAGRIRRYLAAHTDLDVTDLEIRQFEGGQSNPTYLLEMPHAKCVLRRRPPGTLLASAHALDREYRVLKALRSAGVPVPEVYAYCDDENVAGSAFYVMAHVPGRIFFDNSMPDLVSAERARAYDAANATLALLHQVVPEEVGLADFGRAGNYFARQVSRWSKQYAASRTDDIPEMEWLSDWLTRHLPVEAPARVVHGDFSFHNLIYDPHEPTVAAIIDWELATTGDPIADLMYHAMEWYRPDGIDPRGTLAGIAGQNGIPTFDDYVAAYCRRTGRNAIDHIEFHKAFNLFRVAAIIQGVVGRARSSGLVDENALQQEARVRPLAQAAWREANRG